MGAIHQQGRDIIRKAMKGTAGNSVSHVGVATDTTAFNDSQTVLDPANGGAANFLIKAATATDADAGSPPDIQTDFTISINGDTEMTNKNISTLGLQKGSARTDNISRTVRSNPIGVQAGDLYTIGVRAVVIDASP